MCNNTVEIQTYILTVLLNIYFITNLYCIFFFLEFLPEDGRRRPIHVGGLPHVVYHSL